MSSEKVETVPEYKKKLVNEIAEKINGSRSVLIASIKGLPASQFQQIRKSLREKADVLVTKKSLLQRAIGSVEKGALQNLKGKIDADVCVIFSHVDAFELAGILIDSQTPAKAKPGDVAPRDIDVEPGPTELMPGPAISELGKVGLKVAVEGGKLAIKNSATLVKEGEEINSDVASVLGKLDIFPMNVGLIPISAYDSEEDKFYAEIKIDKEGTLEELRNAISKALGFAVGVSHTTKETVAYFIAKAGREEKAIENLLGKEKVEEVKEEDEDKSSEGVDENEDDKVKKENEESEKQEDGK